MVVLFTCGSQRELPKAALRKKTTGRPEIITLNSENNFECIRNVMHRKSNSLPEFLIECSVNKEELQFKGCGQDHVM